MSEKPISRLRPRMIEDMTVRNFVEKTRNDYIRQVRTFTAFLGRSPDTATPEDLRRFQLHQTRTGLRAPSINGSVAAPPVPCAPVSWALTTSGPTGSCTPNPTGPFKRGLFAPNQSSVRHPTDRVVQI
jgi:hypothetical protein